MVEHIEVRGARPGELVENLPNLAELVEPLLIVRRMLREQIGILHGRLLAIVRTADDVCRRLMIGAWCRSCGGAGPIAPRSTYAARFRNSKAVGGGVRSDTCCQVPIGARSTEAVGYRGAATR